jgi:cytochrome P450
MNPIPVPDPQTGLRALQALIAERHPLAALQVFHAELGEIFRINLPGFTPVVMVGPQAARFVLVQARDDLRWRSEDDPVTHLLRHGVLVEDGAAHDDLRRLLSPALHRRMLGDYVAEMWRRAAQVTGEWQDGGVVDMLVEMRKIALLALMHTLYQVDFTPQLRSLWEAVLGCIGYISPGVWMIWRGAPRPGYHRATQEMDSYLYQIITERRRLLDRDAEPPADMLGLLIYSGMEDGLIRDQLLTMLIAGHDTVTALMAWALHLFGQHPTALGQAQAEVDACLDGGSLSDNRRLSDDQKPPDIEQVNSLEYLGQVIKEALRLYPPIHLGSRQAAIDLDYQGYRIPAGERVIYSIYLTQRSPETWPDPDRFDPQRHAPGSHPQPYSWLAFGGGPRNCIGAAYGQIEARVVLAHVLHRFRLEPTGRRVTPYMGATLEPRPGVFFKTWRR